MNNKDVSVLNRHYAAVNRETCRQLESETRSKHLNAVRRCPAKNGKATSEGMP
jgi:hypothetical protein